MTITDDELSRGLEILEESLRASRLRRPGGYGVGP
jgi:hypothetical protein